MLALKNLTRKKIRSLLTLMGVSMGISVFVSVTSYSQNLKIQIQEVITNGFDIVVQEKGAATPFYSKISHSDYAKLKGIAGIDDMPTVVLGHIRTEKNPYFILMGISSVELLLGDIAVVEGRVFGSSENEILLGKRALEKLNCSVNDQIELKSGEIFTVVGTYITGSRIFDNGVVMNIKNAKRILQRKNDINITLLRLKKGYKPSRIIKEIHENIQTLSATRCRDFIGHLKFIQAADAFARTFSYISLVISSIIVINTLLMSISERTREIGILMAVGWSQFMIMKTIFVEAIILCFMGGILGNGIGLLFLWLFNLSSITGLDWATPSISNVVVLQSLGISIALGIVASVYPAILASRLSPAEALRYE